MNPLLECYVYKKWVYELCDYGSILIINATSPKGRKYFLTYNSIDFSLDNFYIIDSFSRTVSSWMKGIDYMIDFIKTKEKTPIHILDWFNKMSEGLKIIYTKDDYINDFTRLYLDTEEKQ